MKLTESQLYYEQIIKYERRGKILSKIKDFNKAPTINYERFIKNITEAQKTHTEASDVYELIISLANKNYAYIEAKKAENPTTQSLSITEYACYKALKNKIASCTPRVELVETAFAMYRRQGIEAIGMSFRECSTRHRKTTTEMQR